MYSNVKKRNTPWSALTETTPILSLPHDLLVNCLARVPRLYYPTLSLVSKSFRALIASPELYEARSLLGCTENCLYVCLPFPDDDLNPRWFTLCRKAGKTPYSNLSRKSSGNILVPISSPKFLAQSCNLIAVGPKIYGIGREGWLSSSRVSVLDCRFHTWHKGPSMRAKRSCSSTASLVDGKIYVAGGNSSERVEVFDPKTQTWSSVTDPGTKFHEHDGDRRVKSFGLEGKFYLYKDYRFDYDGVVYNPKEDKWNPAGRLFENICCFALPYSYCVIDNVWFHWSCGYFEWYDSEVSKWKKVQGLFEDLSNFRNHWSCKIVDYGGKLAALWYDIFSPYYDDYDVTVIWCAEIALERRNKEDGDNMWGKVEWLDDVALIDPGSCDFSKGSALISVTI